MTICYLYSQSCATGTTAKAPKH